MMETDATEVKVKPSKPRQRTPHWDTWKKRPECPLSDAVAISFNLSPWAIKALKKKNPPRYRNYLSRLKTASLATSPEGGTTKGTIKEIKDRAKRSDDPYDRIVSLASFVAFVRCQASWRDKLPEEFLRLGGECKISEDSGPSIAENQDNKPPGNSAVEVTVTLPYITKTLERLFQVMRELSSIYQSERPPKQISVAQAIDNALGNNGSNGKPTRTGEVLATAIRPDRLKESDSRANKRKS